MKKSFLICLFVLITSLSGAYGVEIDGLHYNLDSETKTAEVTSYSIEVFSPQGGIEIPETISYEGVTYSVTSIGDLLCAGCYNLTYVSLPNSLVSIGRYAFMNCQNLTRVNIPSTVTSISSEAFSGCTKLEKVIVEDIGAWCNIAFDGYTANPLYCAHHIYSDENTEITDLVIPNSVEAIGSNAFIGCSSLTSVSLPSSMTSIGPASFKGCSGLTSIVLPQFLTNIGNSAFYGCSRLSSIDIPNSVTNIGGGAFYGCSALKSDILPNDLTIIGSDLFSDCSSLTSIDLPGTVSSIGLNAFKNCSGLTSIKLPDSIKTIENGVFYGCSGLTSIDLPVSVTSIGISAFQNCSSLASISLPSSLTTIRFRAFSGCSGLTSICIPDSVTSIGDEAFYGCKFRVVMIKCKMPPVVDNLTDNGIFSEQTFYHTVLYVPVNCWDAYAFSDSLWWRFINIREIITTSGDISEESVFALMNVNNFQYTVYDPINDCLASKTSDGVDESNPNHCWQMLSLEGQTYLYNLGARKFAVPSDSGKGIALSESLSFIPMADGEDGILLGDEELVQWGLVKNEGMDVDDNLVGTITGIKQNIISYPDSDVKNSYSPSGYDQVNMRKGVNIIRMSDGSVHKVLKR